MDLVTDVMMMIYSVNGQRTNLFCVSIRYLVNWWKFSSSILLSVVRLRIPSVGCMPACRTSGRHACFAAIGIFYRSVCVSRPVIIWWSLAAGVALNYPDADRTATSLLLHFAPNLEMLPSRPFHLTFSISLAWNDEAFWTSTSSHNTIEYGTEHCIYLRNGMMMIW